MGYLYLTLCLSRQNLRLHILFYSGIPLEEGLHILNGYRNHMLCRCQVTLCCHSNHHVYRNTAGNGGIHSQLTGQTCRQNTAADMGGAETRRQYTRCAGHADGRRDGQCHGLFHLIRCAAGKLHESRGSGTGTGAQPLHVAACCALTDSVHAADLQHHRHDAIQQLLIVRIELHNRLHKAGIGTGITGTCTGSQADGVIAHLGSQRADHDTIDKFIFYDFNTGIRMI